MGDIIAHDLEALFPDSAAAIGANLEALKRSLLDLRGDYQDRLIESGADVVFALTSDFVYLTNDMGLFVDGYFIKQDVRWTDDGSRGADEAPARQRHQGRAAQMAAERSHSERRARGGRASWSCSMPAIPESSSIARSRADGLQQILRKNLDAIAAAAGG